MKKNRLKRLLDIDETARYLGIKKSTLYSWASLRRIPSVKMGGRLLFDLNDLDRLIEDWKRGEVVMTPEVPTK